MKTLYKQFIAATLLILVVSTVLGFFLANFFYMNYTKKKTDQQQEDRAREIVKVLDSMHHSGRVSTVILIRSRSSAIRFM